MVSKSPIISMQESPNLRKLQVKKRKDSYKEYVWFLTLTYDDFNIDYEFIKFTVNPPQFMFPNISKINLQDKLMPKNNIRKVNKKVNNGKFI